MRARRTRRHPRPLPRCRRVRGKTLSGKNAQTSNQPLTLRELDSSSAGVVDVRRGDRLRRDGYDDDEMQPFFAEALRSLEAASAIPATTGKAHRSSLSSGLLTFSTGSSWPDSIIWLRTACDPSSTLQPNRSPQSSQSRTYPTKPANDQGVPDHRW